MVNTASVAAVLPIFGTGPYSASKHAVLAISDVLRAELADTEVGVSTVMPGLVRTGMIPAGEDPAVVANAVIAGIRHDRPYVYTDLYMAGEAEQRLQELVTARGYVPG